MIRSLMAACLIAAPAAAQDGGLDAMMGANAAEMTDLFVTDLVPRDPAAGRALEMRVDSAIRIDPAALRAGQIDPDKLALFERLCAEVMVPMAETMNAAGGLPRIEGVRIFFDEAPGAAIGAASRISGVTFAVTLDQGCGHFGG